MSFLKLVKQDLIKLSNNSFQAGIENIKASNEIALEAIRQLMSVTSLYLIFIATIFFLLKDNMVKTYLFLPIRVWLSSAVICSIVSLIFGLVALWAIKKHFSTIARIYLGYSKKVVDYMDEYDTLIVDNLPTSLKFEDPAKPSRFADKLYLIQILLFFSATLSMLVIFIGIISL